MKSRLKKLNFATLVKNFIISLKFEFEFQLKILKHVMYINKLGIMVIEDSEFGCNEIAVVGGGGGGGGVF